MKKILFPLAALLLTAACNKETGTHMLSIEYPLGMGVVFADQTEDSLSFVTTESWRIVSHQTWCSVPENMKSYHNPYSDMLVSFTLPLRFTPNTSGRYRIAEVEVYGGEYTGQVHFLQFDCLNIARPGRRFYSDLLGDIIAPLTDSAFVERDSIVFTAYGDWTIDNASANKGWWSVDRASGGAGTHTVHLTLLPNVLNEEHRDTLLLSSNGVHDSIPLLQLRPLNAEP